MVEHYHKPGRQVDVLRNYMHKSARDKIYFYFRDKSQKSKVIEKFYQQDHVLPFKYLGMRAMDAITIKILKGL